MATYITKRRQSLSCSARSFSDIPAMKKSSADKTHLVSLGGLPEIVWSNKFFGRLLSASLCQVCFEQIFVLEISPEES